MASAKTRDGYVEEISRGAQGENLRYCIYIRKIGQLGVYFIMQWSFRNFE